MKYRIKIWDLPIRLFHWALVVSFAVSVISIEVYGNIEVHFISGLVVLGLIIFRLCWGFLGTSTAKFSNFYPSFTAAYRYLRSDDKANKIGHSPLAAFAVYAMLLALLVQAASGLFSDDEIYFTGPLNRFVGSDVVAILATVHFYTSRLLFVLVALHLLAIAWYFFKKKENLISPMVTGYKNIDEKKIPILKESLSNVSLPLLIISVLIAAGAAAYLYYLN